MLKMMTATTTIVATKRILVQNYGGNHSHFLREDTSVVCWHEKTSLIIRSYKTVVKIDS